MSIASEIARLQADSTAIANAIVAKGVTVPSGSGFDDYAGLIASIPSGGGGLPAWIKDGDTHLWLDIATNDQKDQQLRLRMIGTIDWGDGTTESVSVTTYTTFSHTYASTGKYRIDLKPSSGTFYLGGASGSYSVMGASSGRGNITYALYQAEVGTKQITTVSTYAFGYCRGLIRAYIPKTITTLGNSIFYICTSLRSVEFQDYTTITSTSLTSTFHLCDTIVDVSGFAPPAMTSMSYTYYYCHLLEEVTIPNTVTDIGAGTFYNMMSLKKLKCLPATPPTVANANAFSSFPAAAVIEVPQGKLSAYQSAPIWSTYASQMVEASS